MPACRGVFCLSPGIPQLFEKFCWEQGLCQGSRDESAGSSPFAANPALLTSTIDCALSACQAQSELRGHSCPLTLTGTCECDDPLRLWGSRGEACTRPTLQEAGGKADPNRAQGQGLQGQKSGRLHGGGDF